MKKEIIDLMEENNFYNRITMEKMCHIGLALIALRVAERVEGKKAKLPFKLAMVLLLIDDVQLLVHAIEKWKEYDID